MSKLVIKGALYQNGDMLVIPHFTGEFSIVDCDRYLQKSEIKSDYSKEFYKEATGKYANYIEHEGIKYYACEFDCYTTNNFELLSDLSGLQFTGELL